MPGSCVTHPRAGRTGSKRQQLLGCISPGWERRLPAKPTRGCGGKGWCGSSEEEQQLCFPLAQPGGWLCRGACTMGTQTGCRGGCSPSWRGGGV